MAKRLIDNRYEVLKRLGSGGMGEVCKVRDRADDSILALKLTRKDLPEDWVLRFKKEFYTLFSLRHENIVKVYDFATLPVQDPTWDGRCYFTMEFVPGNPINKAFEGFDKKLYLLLIQILSALDYIHSKGMIHGDLKPGNILVMGGFNKPSAISHKRAVKLLDFGLAEEMALLDPSAITGTLGYIAPELLKGGKVDHRADLYSLGIIIYETLTKRKAFRGKTVTEVLRATLDKELPPPRQLNPEIPQGLEEVLLRLIQKDPRDRYGSSDEVLDELARLSRLKSPKRVRTRVTRLFYSPTVGREGELSVLDDTLSKAKEGKGQLVLICAEVGIGKSRLLQEFKFRAQLSGCRVTSIRTHGLFEQLYGHFGFSVPRSKGLEPKVQKPRAFNHLTDRMLKWVDGSRAPAVLLLDDLECADWVGQEFVGFLARSLRSHPGIIVATYGEDGPSKKMLEMVKDEAFLTRIELSGLEPKETKLLVFNLLDTKEEVDTLADLVHTQTNGNPLLIQETLHSMLRAKILRRTEKRWILHREKLKRLRLSKTMKALAKTWIKGLNKEEADLLSRASILGDRFPLSLLKGISGLKDPGLFDLISSLQRRGLLQQEQGAYYRFSHKWMQEHLYEGIDSETKRKLHKEAADILETVPPDRRQELLPVIAHHYTGARVRGKAFEFSLKAAEKVERNYTPEAALDHYQRALKLAPRARRFELLKKVGDLCEAMGFHREALHNYQSALRLRTAPTHKAELLLKIAIIYRKKKEFRLALRSLEGGLSALGKKSEPLFADLLAERAWIAMEKGHYSKAAKYCAKAEEISKRAEDTVALSNVYNTLGILHWRKGALDKAIRFTRRTLSLRESSKDRLGKARSYNNLGVIYWTKGDMEEAGRCYENALSEFQKLGDIRSVAQIHVNLGLLAWTQGDWESSIKHCHRSYSLFDRLADRAALASVHNRLGVIDEHRGNWSEALEHYQAHKDFHKEIGDPQGEAIALTNLGSLFLKLGEFQKSRESLQEGLRVNRELVNEEGIALSLLNLGILHRDESHWDAALECLDSSIAIYKERKLERDIPTAYRVKGEVLIEQNKLTKAQRLVKKAFSIAKGLNDKLELGHVYRTLGVMYEKQHQNDKALDHFEHALKTFEELGAEYERGRTLLQYAHWRLDSKQDLPTATAQLAQAEDLFGRLGAKADLQRALQLGSLFVRSFSEETAPVVREAQLKALYEVSRVMSSILEVRVLYDKVVDLAVSLLNAERGLLLLGEQKGELTIAAGRGVDSATIRDATTLSHSVVSEVALKGLPVISDDAALDPRFRERESVILNNIHSLLCVPLKLKEKVIGTLYVDSRITSRLFSPEDLSFLNTLANLLAVAIENARFHEDLRQETDHLRKEVKERYRLENLVGKSDAVQGIFNQIETVSKSDASVLVQGETGTGKELVARAIHYNGLRKDKRFMPVECGALPESLAESELFGHKKGAFTDAKEDKPGLFEEADSGTIFLDQVDNLSLRLQAKLLRVLQDGEVRRLGETKPKRVDIRVIAATNRDLKKEVKKGNFRDDLYYRLNTFCITIPPLRERIEDIPLLTNHFLDILSDKTGAKIGGLSKETLNCLMTYHWPGNIRQLEHEIDRLVVLARDVDMITPNLLSKEIQEVGGLVKLTKGRAKGSLKTVVSEVERQMIIDSLQEHNWNQTKTARALGISRPSLIEKMSRYRIKREKS